MSYAEIFSFEPSRASGIVLLASLSPSMSFGLTGGGPGGGPGGGFIIMADTNPLLAAPIGLIWNISCEAATKGLTTAA